ncbi:MAG: DedA family protein [Candidatus Aminicenantales bacterium]
MPSIPKLVTHFPYVGLFVLLVLGGLGFPFPEGITLMLCGFLISHGIIRPLYALIVVFAGMLTGDLLTFFLGRKYGHKVVTLRIFHKILSPRRLSSLEDTFTRRKILYILFERYLGSTVFLVAGILRMSYLWFLGLDIVSSFLAIGLFVGAGYLGGKTVRVLKKDITRIEHWGILLAVILLAAYLCYRYFKARRDRDQA